MASRYDAIVIGAGPAGETVVERLQKQRLRVALVERELVGGECAYWACIPSKTMLRAVEARAAAERVAGLDQPELHWRELARYRDYMIRDLDDTNQADAYKEQGVDLYRGAAEIVDQGTVEVAGETLHAERLILATGSEPTVPSIDGLADSGYWTNREATTLTELPSSAVILGGGPVGVELAQLLRRVGVETTLLEAGERLLAREDAAVGELVAQILAEEGIDVRVAQDVRHVSREQARRVVTLAEGERVSADELIVATGRSARVGGLGLDAVGIEADKEGIRVDHRCRAADGIWAVGDVTGVAPFTHVAKYQARIAIQDIAGKQPSASYEAIPRVVFSDPEIAAVGLTEAQAGDRGIELMSAHVHLAETIARPHTYEREPRGELALFADRERDVLIGAWAVAPLAGEWIHQAALAIKAEVPIAVLLDSVPQFPTFSEGYLNALEALAPAR